MLMKVIDEYSYYECSMYQQRPRLNRNFLNIDRFFNSLISISPHDDVSSYTHHNYQWEELSIIGNVLWTCVILCRPLGAQEGEAYSRTETKNYRNINQMEKSNSITTVLFVIDRFENYPCVLAKAFWLIVNLSLIDQIKRYLIHQKIIQKICHAMKKYPNHRELQYRACFALINVTLRCKLIQFFFCLICNVCCVSWVWFVQCLYVFIVSVCK